MQPRQMYEVADGGPEVMRLTVPGYGYLRRSTPTEQMVGSMSRGQLPSADMLMDVGGDAYTQGRSLLRGLLGRPDPDGLQNRRDTSVWVQ